MIVTVIWLSLFHYYTAFSGFLAYLFIICKKIKISKTDFLFLCGFMFLMYLHFFTGSLSAAILDFRYYWGWLIFYFIFKSNPVSSKTLVKTLVLLSVMTLLEAFLVNTIMTTAMLPNFIDTTNDGGANLALFGVYQRPFSFGGIAPVGGALLVVLMALCNVRGRYFWLATLAVLSLASGTGAVVLMLLLLAKYKRRFIMIMFAPLIFLIPWLLWFHKEFIIFSGMLFEKVNLKYLLFMAHLFWTHVGIAVGKITTYSLLFGAIPGGKGVSGHGGDWGLLTFVLTNGFFGLFLLLMMVFSRINKWNRLPIFLLLLSSLHYSAMSTLPGQMIFGLLLSIDKKGLHDDVEYSCKTMSAEAVS